MMMMMIVTFHKIGLPYCMTLNVTVHAVSYKREKNNRPIAIDD